MDKFELVSEFKPQGDQPQAIQTLVDGIKKGEKCQTLLGVTGSGKTFTMANVIAQVNKPTIVLAHNKTLAAQLCSEFKEFLNGTDASSIQTTLSKAVPDTLFDKIKTSENKRIARVASDLGAFNEILKGYIASGDDPKNRFV